MTTNFSPDELALALNTLLGEPQTRERLARLLAGTDPSQRLPMDELEYRQARREYDAKLADAQLVFRSSFTPGPKSEGRLALGFYSRETYARNFLFLEISGWDGEGMKW